MTVRGYTTALTQFAAWFEKQTRAGLDPARLTPLDVRRYRQYLVEERRRQPATVNQHLTALRAFCLDYPEAKPVLLHRGSRRYLEGGVLCLPCGDFLVSLRPDRPFRDILAA